MSYTPTTWATGDVITAEKLNNMESGIAGGQQLYVVSVISEGNQDRLDKTFGEIKSAAQAGKVIVISFAIDTDNTSYNGYVFGTLAYSKNGEGGTVVFIGIAGETVQAIAETDADYPSNSNK